MLMTKNFKKLTAEKMLIKNIKFPNFLLFCGAFLPPWKRIPDPLT
jgi:hypothetical protein